MIAKLWSFFLHNHTSRPSCWPTDGQNNIFPPPCQPFFLQPARSSCKKLFLGCNWVKEYKPCPPWSSSPRAWVDWKTGSLQFSFQNSFNLVIKISSDHLECLIFLIPSFLNFPNHWLWSTTELLCKIPILNIHLNLELHYHKRWWPQHGSH